MEKRDSQKQKERRRNVFWICGPRMMVLTYWYIYKYNMKWPNRFTCNGELLRDGSRNSIYDGYFLILKFNRHSTKNA